MTNPLYVIEPDHDDVPLNSDALHAGWTIELPAPVKRHAIGAMRLAAGDRLQLSDGQGLRINAEIVDSGNGVARVIDFITEPRPVTRLALVQALAKTGHDTAAVDMATQIGVDEVIPWQAERSIAKWKAGKTDRRWNQTLVAATEQSRRAWKPELDECVNGKGVVAICRRACVHGDLVVVLHQDATTTWAGVEERVAAMEQRCLDDGRPRSVYVVVGPEGGIGDDEIERFTEAGAEVCVLGSNIMRASTAGPVALSLLARALGRFA
ncbi:16S rRNA (uracil(1498)-N(3))-methyltransferase [Bifidobacterium sp. ESL0763]|uniref:16S rRNA (uracil(1498)-N(3))-methyltransferase n=1 Tax=Bifidobacterium sp. ESL0763 TaxID=2983227 RepID=UPI0023F7DC65|nr:16S rRNA (uracil(1498)-N(3))-methyltransferase [Bifidobacterium sp. ESL0763]MDF7663895.1 16S rRNA (uracil(1498)-N(3))-methyltransferase [Bifidobacterium sp. ESL0763]